ncbi:MAG: hypothetical protein R2932_09485 [Caldilineaceae bacterium]
MMNDQKYLASCALIVVALALLVSGCVPVAPQGATTAAPASEPDSLTAVKLGVGYIPNVQFTLFMSALRRAFMLTRAWTLRSTMASKMIT